MGGADDRPVSSAHLRCRGRLALTVRDERKDDHGEERGGDQRGADPARPPPGPDLTLLAATLLGLTASEISEATDVPLGTVKTRIRRGLRRLRDELHMQAAL